MWLSIIIGIIWAENELVIAVYLFLSFLLELIIVSVDLTLTACVITNPGQWTSILTLNTL